MLPSGAYAMMRMMRSVENRPRQIKPNHPLEDLSSSRPVVSSLAIRGKSGLKLAIQLKRQLPLKRAMLACFTR